MSRRTRLHSVELDGEDLDTMILSFLHPSSFASLHKQKKKAIDKKEFSDDKKHEFTT